MGSPVSTRFRTLLSLFFSIDVRALAAMRISLGLLFLYDLLLRFSTIPEHYGDASSFPTYLTTTFWNGEWAWSLHTLGGGPLVWLYFLFAVHIVVTCTYIVGYKTRYMQFALWVLLVSLLHANPFITQGGEVWGRVILFTLLFLPTGAVWSVDAFISRTPTQRRIMNGWTAALLLQIAFFYFFASQFKIGPEWENGLAIYYALSGLYYPKLFAHILITAPSVLQLLTYAIMYLQTCTPILLFSPFLTQKIRMVTVAILALMHVGLALTLRVAHFSLVSIAVLVVYAPSSLLDVLQKKLPRWVPVPKYTDASSHRSFWQKTAHTASSMCAIVYLLYILSWQAASSPMLGTFITFPPQLTIFGKVLRIDEYWNIFASPLDVRGWNIIAAETFDGEIIDILRNGEPVDFTRPARAPELALNSHQRRFLHELDYSHAGIYRKPAADYWCKQWNKRHPENRIRAITYIYMDEYIPKPYESLPENIEPHILYSGDCPRGIY